MSTHCAIENCKTTLHSRLPGVTLHPCPTNPEMRNKWLKLLKNRCHIIDWSRSKICSKHFENKYFDSQRKLKNYALPTLFSSQPKDEPKSKVDRLIARLSQSELTNDIKQNLPSLKEPANLDIFVNDNLRCKSDAPLEAKLWLMLKKQNHLTWKLQELVVKTKKEVENLQNDRQESKSNRREQEQTIESLKYIEKCLQEKHATLKEQIEILTAVESR